MFSPELGALLEDPGGCSHLLLEQRVRVTEDGTVLQVNVAGMEDMWEPLLDVPASLRPAGCGSKWNKWPSKEGRKWGKWQPRQKAEWLADGIVKTVCLSWRAGSMTVDSRSSTMGLWCWSCHSRSGPAYGPDCASPSLLGGRKLVLPIPRHHPRAAKPGEGSCAACNAMER